MQIKKPKRLQSGDTIAMIAPASNVWEDEDILIARETLTSLGFRVKCGTNIRQRHGYLAGRDEARLADLHAAFADDEVDAVFAMRGGYGSMRLLPHLDFDLIRANPKPLMGFSDITSLLNAVLHRSGLVTFHGHNVNQPFTDYSLDQFRRVLMDAAVGRVAEPPPFEFKPGMPDRNHRLSRLVPGKARGRLVGGNLYLMSRLLGTPYDPDYRGCILLLEDVAEEPRRVDGMLTHLWLAGKLDDLAGVVIGKLSLCQPKMNPSLSMEEVLRERFESVGVPTLRGLPIGHMHDNATLPLGVKAELDVDAGTLQLLEPAVL